MSYVYHALAIAAGGAAGAVLRWVVGLACLRLFGPHFPVGTMLINLSGSFLLGWFVGMVAARPAIPDAVRLALATGVLGAYTTFSTFMLESVALWDSGSVLRAVANVVGSIVLGLVALRLGMLMAG